MKFLLFASSFYLFIHALCFSTNKNIILFITDDQSPDAGCYGNKKIKMPNLDALAADGTLFTNAFATTASCSASRSVVLTGLHNHLNGQYGHQHNYHKFSSFHNTQSLPVLLSRHGYRTFRIGKYHVAPEYVYKFDYKIQGNQRNAVQMARECEKLINNKSSKPFFLYFATSDPHRGGGIDKNSKYKPDLFGNKPNKQSHNGVSEVHYGLDDVEVPPFLPDTPTCRAELAQYYQSCTRIDQGLGELIKILKKAGKYNDTLLIFTSDHGIAMPGGKTTVYDPGLRVPFVVRNPYSTKKGVVNNAMISHIDITPSILDFAGAYNKETKSPKDGLINFDEAEKRANNENKGPKIKSFHGRSWVPILEKNNPDGWDNIGASHTFHEIQMYYPMRVMRDRNYKLIWNIAYPLPFPFASDLWIAPSWQAQFKQGLEAKYGQKTVKNYIQRDEFEFFDIKNDPNETSNLSSNPKYSDLLNEYKKKLKSMQKRTNDPWIVKWSYE